MKRHGEHAPFFLYVRLSLPLAVAAHTVSYLIFGFLPVDLTFATVPTANGRMVLRVEPHSASSRITVCFESNHGLLRVESHLACTRIRVPLVAAYISEFMVLHCRTTEAGYRGDRSASGMSVPE